MMKSFSKGKFNYYFRVLWNNVLDASGRATTALLKGSIAAVLLFFRRRSRLEPPAVMDFLLPQSQHKSLLCLNMIC